MAAKGNRLKKTGQGFQLPSHIQTSLNKEERLLQRNLKDLEKETKHMMRCIVQDQQVAGTKLRSLQARLLASQKKFHALIHAPPPVIEEDACSLTSLDSLVIEEGMRSRKASIFQESFQQEREGPPASGRKSNLKSSLKKRRGSTVPIRRKVVMPQGTTMLSFRDGNTVSVPWRVQGIVKNEERLRNYTLHQLEKQNKFFLDSIARDQMIAASRLEKFIDKLNNAARMPPELMEPKPSKKSKSRGLGKTRKGRYPPVRKTMPLRLQPLSSKDNVGKTTPRMKQQGSRPHLFPDISVPRRSAKNPTPVQDVGIANKTEIIIIEPE